MNAVRLIEAKRDGAELDTAGITALIDGYAREQVPDYQMAAFAMAVLCRGMSPRETMDLTRAMLHSGQTMQWPAGGPVVDKHSTGGIGDKLSVPLAPILADLGMRVPMISGRGLGATGGTIDKLESIPGYRTNLQLPEIIQQIAATGCVITAATSEIAPADRKLYALRDVTGTVKSVPLITASILSKKLAEGLDCLVLDVKWGSGAFMKTLAEARELASSLVRTAGLLGVPTTALVTDMNQPLGSWIGNSLEIDESVQILKGCGPADSTALTVALAVELLSMTGLQTDATRAEQQVQESIASGRALAHLDRMVSAQGGDLEARRPQHAAREWPAGKSGFVRIVDCEKFGWAVIEMGGGRKVLGETLDLGTGIEMLVRDGDRVTAGQPLMRICYNGEWSAALRELLAGAVEIADEPPPKRPLIVERLGWDRENREVVRL